VETNTRAEVSFVRALSGPSAFGDDFPTTVRVLKKLAHVRGWRLPGVVYEYSTLHFALGLHCTVDPCVSPSQLRNPVKSRWVYGDVSLNVVGVMRWLLAQLRDGVLVHPFNGSNVLGTGEVPSLLQAAVLADLRAHFGPLP
jgi:hypothetical protein